MHMLVTRPEPQASAWVRDLGAQGIVASALPLIAIDGPLDPAPVHALWQHMAAHKLLMFVSPAAVEWFFRLKPAQATWAPGTMAATPGPGTARSLIATGSSCGLTAQHIICPDDQAEQFDSETLWPLLAPMDWQGQQVSVISGGDQTEAKGRNWLSAQWQARGATVSSVLTYQRGPGQWSPAQQAVARQALLQPSQHIWLFSSSQAIDHLQSCHIPALALPTAPDWSPMQALVTHPKIAERARQLGIAHVSSTRPTLDAVVEALRSAS